MKHCNRRCVLVVEDDEPKQRSIDGLLQERLVAGIDIIYASSLSSAIRVLSTRKVLLAIVDMSLPTYDFATDRSGGGKPQGFGGTDILRFIESETSDTLSIVLTQYEEFPLGPVGGRRDVAQLEKELQKELSVRFLGVVHYAGQQGDWRDQLALRIDSLDILVK